MEAHQFSIRALLPAPGLAADQHEMRFALLCCLECLPQPFQLGMPPDEMSVTRRSAKSSDPADEPVAMAVHGLHIAGRPWVITKRLADLADADGETAVADDPARPDRVGQLVFAERLPRMADQQPEQLSGFLPQRNVDAIPRQRAYGTGETKRTEIRGGLARAFRISNGVFQIYSTAEYSHISHLFR